MQRRWPPGVFPAGGGRGEGARGGAGEGNTHLPSCRPRSGYVNPARHRRTSLLVTAESSGQMPPTPSLTIQAHDASR